MNTDRRKFLGCISTRVFAAIFTPLTLPGLSGSRIKSAIPAGDTLITIPPTPCSSYIPEDMIMQNLQNLVATQVVQPKDADTFLLAKIPNLPQALQDLAQSAPETPFCDVTRHSIITTMDAFELQQVLATSQIHRDSLAKVIDVVRNATPKMRESIRNARHNKVKLPHPSQDICDARLQVLLGQHASLTNQFFIQEHRILEAGQIKKIRLQLTEIENQIDNVKEK